MGDALNIDTAVYCMLTPSAVGYAALVGEPTALEEPEDHYLDQVYKEMHHHYHHQHHDGTHNKFKCQTSSLLTQTPACAAL